MDEVVRMTTPSSPRYLRVVRGIVMKSAALAGLSDKQGRDLALAVSEGCANVIEHGYGGQGNGKIVLTCRAREGEVEIRIRDFGIKPDPETVKPRDLADVRPGGLGIYLMQNLVDEVQYDFRHKVGTELILKKSTVQGEKSVPPRAHSGLRTCFGG